MGPVMENPLVEHALVQLDRPLVKGKEVGAQPPGEGIGVPQDGRESDDLRAMRRGDDLGQGDLQPRSPVRVADFLELVDDHQCDVFQEERVLYHELRHLLVNDDRYSELARLDRPVMFPVIPGGDHGPDPE